MPEFSSDSAAICERIQRLAAERGFLKTELARRAGLSYRLIYDIFNGTAKPRESTIGKIASALGACSTYIATGRGPQDSNGLGLYPDTKPNVMVVHETGPGNGREGEFVEAVRIISRHLGIHPSEVMRHLWGLVDEDSG